MHLTTAQLQTLKTYIASVPAWAALPNDSEAALFIAGELNKQAAPDFIVWRTAVTRDEVTVDGFDWTQVDNLTTGQARIWDLLFDNSSKTINAAEAGKRAGIAECWKGTAAKVAVATFVLGKCKRAATVIEKVLAAGAGTLANPAVMAVEGAIGYDDVQAARSL